MADKMEVTNNNKKEDKKFKKKNIKHDPQDESSRAVFGEPREKQ
ncbi:MAG: CPC_1213 family protein [Bacillota bacterium]|nr:CPC_1213 family protein [Bacillota bacterium]MDP4179408.1 CPC_1213 family protein [Bacillota bacterium]